MYVADTCTLIWYLTDDPKLRFGAPEVFELMEAASRGVHRVFISAITIVELVYLVEKNKLPEDMVEQLLKQVSLPGSMFTLSDVTTDIAMKLQHVKNNNGKKLDMPDRIIAADGMFKGFPVFTCDEKVCNSTCQTIWR